MTPAIGLEFAVVAVAQQRVVVRIRFEVDVAAVPTLAARRPAARNILLPPERDAAVAAVATLHHDFRFICKHGRLTTGTRSKTAYARISGKNRRTERSESACGEFQISIGGGRCSLRFFGSRGFLDRQNADEAPEPALVFKLHEASGQREEGVILGATDVPAGLVARTALANQDASAVHQLSAKTLHAEALPLRVAPVYRRSAALFVCHGSERPLGKLNVADLHGGVALPVAALDLVLPARLVLQHFHLRPAHVLHNLARNLGLYGVSAGQHLLFVRADGQHVVEGHFAADFSLEEFHLDRRARLHAVLLPPTPNHGVHAASPLN